MPGSMEEGNRPTSAKILDATVHEAGADLGATNADARCAAGED